MVAFAALAPPPVAASERCDVALVLALDVSGSVDPTEWDLQRRGTAQAVLSPRVASAVQSGPYGQIAVAVTQWHSEPSVAVPWVLVRGAADLAELAAGVEQIQRAGSGSTALGSAIVHAVGLFASAPCEPLRLVVDVSGDGRSNHGLDVRVARSAAAAADVTVNALVIEDRTEPGLEAYFRDDVVTGPGAFVLVAEGFGDIARALTSKLVIEVGAYGQPMQVAGR